MNKNSTYSSRGDAQAIRFASLHSRPYAQISPYHFSGDRIVRLYTSYFCVVGEMGLLMKISPSVLASNFADLGGELRAMEQAGADMLHLDVMDGHFVPNISFGVPVVAGLRKTTKLFFDVHLMISHPLRYIATFVQAGSDMITFHVESESDVKETIACIRAHGRMAGIALKPGTPADAVYPYLELVDMVLVMTVEPGFGGQSFMEDQMRKLAQLRDVCRERGLDMLLQVDGGIDNKTASVVAKNGANVLVAGSALFREKDYAAAVQALRASALSAL